MLYSQRYTENKYVALAAIVGVPHAALQPQRHTTAIHYSFAECSEPLGVSTVHALQVEQHYSHATTDTVPRTTDSVPLQHRYSHTTEISETTACSYTTYTLQHGACTTARHLATAWTECAVVPLHLITQAWWMKALLMPSSSHQKS